MFELVLEGCGNSAFTDEIKCIANVRRKIFGAKDINTEFLEIDPTKKFDIFDEIFHHLDARSVYNSFFSLRSYNPPIIQDAVTLFNTRQLKIIADYRSGLCGMKDRYNGPAEIIKIIAELDAEIKLCRQTCNLWISLVEAYYNSKLPELVDPGQGPAKTKTLLTLFTAATPMQIAATCPTDGNLIQMLKDGGVRVQVWRDFLKDEQDKFSSQNTSPRLGVFFGPAGLQQDALYRQLIKQFAIPCVQKFEELYGRAISKTVALLIPDNDCDAPVLKSSTTLLDTKD